MKAAALRLSYEQNQEKVTQNLALIASLVQECDARDDEKKYNAGVNKKS